MLNSCNFTGRFADDPRYFETAQGGRAIFTLAIDRDRKNDDGGYDTDFLDFVIWGGKSKFVMQYFHKGDMATVSNARAQVRNYTDSAGVSHRKIEFRADNVYFGQAKKKEEE